MLGLDLAALIARAIVLLIAFTVHEFAHAWVAYQLGDTTQASQGRLTLNPRAHIIPWLYILAVLTGFGMAKPVYWYPSLLRVEVRRGGLLIAVAGPVSNLVLATLAGIPVRLGLASLTFSSGNSFVPTLDFLLTIFIYLNLIMAIFNMIPIPPLDGYRVLLGLLPYELANAYQRIEPWGMFILLGLIFLGSMGSMNLLGMIIGPPIDLFFRLLTG
jgi:Zn-dependent protease